MAAFVLTFIAARGVVYLIMTRAIPDLYLYVGGTHVHHLNYGIVLLAGVGAYLIFRRPMGRRLSTAAILYGVSLALTFDEFGMWFHLGGSYWQRASYDAIVVIASLLGLVAAAPSIRRFRPRHWATTAVVAIAALLFAAMIIESLRLAENAVLPRLERLDASDRPK
ncbi:MAG: hypothetical protein IT450_13920 [Phycisphaerales bacterium]|nr:hypothetical protein [Phycisphaerales bacterium]